MGRLAVCGLGCALGLMLLAFGVSARAEDAAVSAPPGPASASHAAAAEAFVTVQDGQFAIAGKPFRFVGANASVIHGANERMHADAILDAVAADGLRVVRIWALGEQPAPGKSYHPLYAFRIGETGWVEASFVQLDRVLAAAKQRNLRVILVLANRWKDYGGIGTYADWAGSGLSRDLQGEPQGTALSAFYECPKCDVFYRQHVERLITRASSVSGVAYRDDPTILAWELINEASAVTARDEETLVAWMQAQARYVRSLDAKHLISAGHIGYSNQREHEVWKRVQALPEIDFADAHAYPLKDPRVMNPARLRAWIDDRIATANELHKPFVFGEFGFDRGSPWPRTRWTEMFLEHAAKRGAAGALIWNYEPAANPRSPHSISEDETDVDSRAMRRSLKRASKAFEAPARVTPISTRFMYTQTLRGVTRPHRDWVEANGVRVLDIDPLLFARATFERAGVYQESALNLAYGGGAGFIEYRFESPRTVAKALIVEARISSELPGYGLGQDARDGRDIQIEIDGHVIGTVRAKPDDGLGELVRVRTDEPKLLRAIFRNNTHSLRFVALPTRYAGGLCVYGTPTGVVPLDPAGKRDLDQVRIQVVE